MIMAIIKIKSGNPKLRDALIEELNYQSFYYDYNEKKQMITVYYDNTDEKASKRFSSIIWFYDYVIESVDYDSFLTIDKPNKKQTRLDKWC